VKRQALRCAVEVATAVLRIDDVTAAKLKGKKTEVQRYKLEEPDRPWGL
jgi:chaperonin GroEL (HSP60 family)